MTVVAPFELPLISGGPPEGYGWEDRSDSEVSSTTAFEIGLDGRDTFLGQRRCVVCGEVGTAHLDRSHIIPQDEGITWTDLRERGWLPTWCKRNPEHEPRNGLTLCATHHRGFDAYLFYIRFFPQSRKFVLINHSGSRSYKAYHGKAIALNINDRYAPFSSLFIVHEMRVHGSHPFRPAVSIVPDEIRWQEWIETEGVLGASGPDGLPTFNRKYPPDHSLSSRIQSAPNVESNSMRRVLAPSLGQGTINEILAATHAMPS